MKTLHVNLGARSYDIQIAQGILDKAGEEIKAVCPRARRLFVVTDSNVFPLYLTRLANSLTAAGFEMTALTVPAGESSKCVSGLGSRWG